MGCCNADSCKPINAPGGAGGAIAAVIIVLLLIVAGIGGVWYMKKNQKGPFAAGGKFAKTAPSSTKANEAKKVEMVSAEPQAVDVARRMPLLPVMRVSHRTR